ncbi:peptidoglycan editing factor PgeF [Thermoproteota archaeon]
MNKATLKEFHSFYQFQNLPSNVKAVFTKKPLNVGFVNQNESQMSNNRKRILSEIGLKLDNLVCSKQTHSNEVFIVGAGEAGRGARRFSDAINDVDAFITKEKNIALAVFTADCVPVFIIDKKRDIIALVHAGWKGTKQAIVKNVVFAMQQVFETDSKDLAVYLGPAIRRCCFQVDKEFLGYFSRGIYRKKGKLFLDMIELNSLQLREVGVLEDNIFDSELCTNCEKDTFFSYRREKDKSGRQMSLIVIDNQDG